MTIRARLTLWYAVIMFISLVTMSLLTYHEFAADLAPEKTADNRASESDESDLGQMLRILFWCGVPSALIALGGGWWLMRRSLNPITRLTHAVEKIHESNLRQQLPQSGNGDELDRLTAVFNAMTARLDTAFQRIREFTLHASHELKTPLTILHGELESELNNEALQTAQREKLLGQLDEIQRLAKIVDGLTLLTKADAGQVALNFETLSLDEIVRDVFDDAQILAQPAAVSVRVSACEPARIRGDRHRLRQLLLNLAENAVKYNRPGGTIELALCRRDSKAELTISNTGKGIPSEILPHVFERFFRGDPAHNSAVDGCGLGLSISQWIAQAHGGSLTVDSVLEKLTVVTLHLPLV